MRLLCVDQIMIDDLCCCFPYCIHPLHPKHLIFGFECFGNGIFLSKLLYQPKEHILCLFVQIGKVTVELPAKKQAVIQSFDDSREYTEDAAVPIRR